jgi:hypothetical protein
LTWQSQKRVALALDFVSVKASVDNREIDTCDPLAEPNFIKDQRVSFGRVPSPHLRVKAAPDVDVPNMCVRHQARL